MSENQNQMTTSRGHVVEFLSIAPLLDELRAWQIAHTPQPPTYTPTTAPGFIAQPVPHHYRIVKVKELNDEGSETGKEIDKVDTSLESDSDFDAWHAYEKELANVEAQFEERMAKVVLMRGIRVEMPTDDEWVKDQEFMGFDVPTDPRARAYYWRRTELAATKTEIQEIAAGVMRASGISEEVIGSLEASFRDQVRKPGRDSAQRAVKADSANGSGMVLQPAVRAG